MHLSEARASRIVAHAELDFSSLSDPRARSTLPHAAFFGVMVAGFAAGKLSPRDLEDFVSSLSFRLKRKLGWPPSLSDTSLYELLVRQSEDGFRQVLHRQIRSLWDQKALRHDLSDFGVLSIDGKGAGFGLGAPPNAHCKRGGAAADPFWHLFLLRAVLVSCSAAPVIDQEFLEHKRGESTGFKTLFRRAVQQFPKLFEVVTTDAGMTAAANAQLVGEHGKHYLFGLKANQHRLFALARALLQGRPEVARTDEREQGYQVSRVLRVVACPESVEFPFARYFWSVTRTQQKGAEIKEEERLFITSVPAERMDDEERLGLVRMHWRIENGSNWTNDVIFKEDTRVLCSKGDGPLVQAWVTVLAQNLVGMVRHHLPEKDRRPVAWEMTRSAIFEAFLKWTPRCTESAVCFD